MKKAKLRIDFTFYVKLHSIMEFFFELRTNFDVHVPA